MEYTSNAAGVTGYYPQSSTGTTVTSSNPKQPSEFERESIRLSNAIEYGQKLVQDLHQKLTPILKTLPPIGNAAEKMQEPQTQHGQFLSVSANRVTMINDALVQILQSVEI